MRYVWLIAVVCLGAQPAVAGEGVPFRETFAGGKADAGWQTHASAGNEVAVREGHVEIRARLNTYAHLARHLGVDNVAVSARIRPSEPTGVSWCTSLFLVWQGGDWCQMGLIPRYYAVETLNGTTVENYLDTPVPAEWHSVRIELGKDCLRYWASDDGTSWRCLRVIRRPATLAGPPRLLVIGKGYGRGQAPFAGPNLQNDYQDPAQMATSAVADVVVEPTPRERVKLTPDERRRLVVGGLDPVAVKELAGRADPALEKVAAHYPTMKGPREAVGVPEHAEDIGIDAQGRLQLNSAAGDPKAPVAWLEVGEPPVFPGAGDPPLTRQLLEGYLPIVTLTAKRGGLEYEQTTFGWTEGFRAESELFALVRLRVRGSASLPASAQLVCHPGGQRVPLPLHSTKAGEAEGCLRIPFRSPEQAVPIEPVEYTSLLAQTARFWRELLAQGTRVSVPEPWSDAYKAWLAYSLLDVDKVGERYEPHDGAGFYEEVYGYSATLYCNALDLYGRHEHAERYLDSILQRQQPDGLYTENFGLPDQGALLLAMAEHYRLTGDAAWLSRVAPKMVLACEWLMGRRKDAPKSGVTAGLIKYNAYCDYREQTFSYYGNAYCCVGLERAATVLAEAGPPEVRERAQGFLAEAKRYRADILRSMDAAAIRRKGHTILPIEPDTHRLLKASNYQARDYYSLVASCLLECEFLPANDRRAYWVTDFLEREEGLLAGVGRFLPGGIDHAYTYGYMLMQLQRGNVGRYLLALYGSLAYGMTRDTYSGVECTLAVSGENQQTLPHLYSCTQQLRMLRMLLLREEGDTLRIGDAVPRAWLEAGKQIDVRGAATRFGPVSFHVASRGFASNAKSGADRIDVRIDAPTRTPPSRILLRLRHPRERPIRSVTVDGRPWRRFSGEVVTLAGLRQPANVRVEYR